MSKEIIKKTKKLKEKDTPGPGQYVSEKSFQKACYNSGHQYSFGKEQRKALIIKRTNNILSKILNYKQRNSQKKRFCCKQQQDISNHILYFGIVRERSKTITRID